MSQAIWSRGVELIILPPLAGSGKGWSGKDYYMESQPLVQRPGGWRELLAEGVECFLRAGSVLGQVTQAPLYEIAHGFWAFLRCPASPVMN